MQRSASLLLALSLCAACTPPAPPPRSDAAPDLTVTPIAAPDAGIIEDTQPESPFGDPPDAAPDLAVSGAAAIIVTPDGAPTAATLHIGAAGIYPPVTAKVAAGQLAPLPSNHADLIGELGTPDMYTLLAISDDRRHAAWLDALPDALPDAQAESQPAPARYTVKLQPAHPLSVRVIRADGTPQPGASVTLQRSRVDLVRLRATTDASGVARLNALPHGDYHVTVRAAGATIVAQAITHGGDGVPTVQLASARVIAGRVVDAAGAPVRDAIVTAHHDRWGTPAELDVRDLERVRKLATVAWADADPDGTFEIDQLPAGVIYLTVVAPGFVPKLSQALDLRDALETRDLRVTLERGRTMRVLVADQDGAPAPQADVTWTDKSGAQGHAITDAAGYTTLDGLPSSAMLSASLDAWSAAPTALPSSDALTLVLKPPGERRDLKLRFNNVAEGVTITGLSATTRGGESCEGARVVGAARPDWLLKRCQPGPATLLITTAGHGELALPATLQETLEVGLPSPTPVTITVTLADAAGATPQLQWRDPIATRPFERLDDTRWRWRGAAYPGERKIILNTGGAAHEELIETLKIGAAPLTQSFTLRALRATPLLVVDPRGKPVTGAHVEVWSEGALLKQGTSAGAAPLQIDAPDGAALRVFAFTPRDGEGSAEARAPERALVTIDQRPHSAALPQRLTDRADLARQLGAPIIEDSGGWRVDVTDASSPAARAGIPRGAYLLYARRSPRGLDLLICDTDASPARRVSINR